MNQAKKDIEYWKDQMEFYPTKLSKESLELAERRLERKEEELDKYDFVDPVLGRINIKQALEDRAKAIEDEYELFNRMHMYDGTLNKCPRKL